jgi:hypothetical protein
MSRSTFGAKLEVICGHFVARAFLGVKLEIDQNDRRRTREHGLLIMHAQIANVAVIN